MSGPNEAAFPIAFHLDQPGQDGALVIAESGMTTRQLFVLAAMKGMAGRYLDACLEGSVQEIERARRSIAAETCALADACLKREEETRE